MWIDPANKYAVLLNQSKAWTKHFVSILESTIKLLNIDIPGIVLCMPAIMLQKP